MPRASSAPRASAFLRSLHFLLKFRHGRPVPGNILLASRLSMKGATRNLFSNSQAGRPASVLAKRLTSVPPPGGTFPTDASNSQKSRTWGRGRRRIRGRGDTGTRRLDARSLFTCLPSLARCIGKISDLPAQLILMKHPHVKRRRAVPALRRWWIRIEYGGSVCGFFRVKEVIPHSRQISGLRERSKKIHTSHDVDIDAAGRRKDSPRHGRSRMETHE